MTVVYFLPHPFSEFMVDSGSDVVTLREEVLQKLDLQLLGTIQSRGVHSTKQKQLYKAVLKIGDVEVETEVTINIIVWQRFCEPARLRIAYCQCLPVLSGSSYLQGLQE